MRLIAAAVAIALLAPGASAAARPLEPASTPTATYDEYLRTHLAHPAAVEARAFMDRVEQRARGDARPAAALGYGKPGCAPARAYEVGDQREFWVYQEQLETMQIRATLAAKSPHSYIWVQNEVYLEDAPAAPGGGIVTRAEAEDAAKDWENIYEIDRHYFGNEPNPNVVPMRLPPGLPEDWRDVDCDVRVHILNFPIDTGGVNGYVAGYFSPVHEYPNGPGDFASPYSNEAEMIFMNSIYLDVGSNLYAAVLAHEFFHMIQFANDYNEQTWVNEGMADVAIVVNGFEQEVQQHVSAFEQNPDQHLFDWRNTPADYGQAFLFFDYFFNHYGQPEDPKTNQKEAYSLARRLTSTVEDGADGVSKVLASRSPALLGSLKRYYKRASFRKVYTDWLVANFVDKPGAAVGQFGYANREVKVRLLGTSQSYQGQRVYPYGADYFQPSRGGRLSARAEDPVAIIPARDGQPRPQDGFFAWSNRADSMYTWLVRSADLRKAKHPELEFRHWYDIETDYDYAYLRISTDGGDSWEFVNTSPCGGRPTNPHGNNNAALQSGGITGYSGGWRTCSLDLTPYAGRRAFVRFEYSTDSSQTRPGYVLDNVKLTDGKRTIWKTSRFETRRASRAWHFDGNESMRWLRIRPLAKNRPLFQIVHVGGGEVRRRVLTRKAFERLQGDLQLESRPRIRAGSVLIFSATTPVATEPFTYSYRAQ